MKKREFNNALIIRAGPDFPGPKKGDGEMEKGDWVTIYEDPITQERPEGTAELLERHFCGPGNAEHWNVHFIGDHRGETYDRIIYPDLPGTRFRT